MLILPAFSLVNTLQTTSHFLLPFPSALVPLWEKKHFHSSPSWFLWFLFYSPHLNQVFCEVSTQELRTTDVPFIPATPFCNPLVHLSPVCGEAMSRHFCTLREWIPVGSETFPVSNWFKDLDLKRKRSWKTRSFKKKMTSPLPSKVKGNKTQDVDALESGANTWSTDTPSSRFLLYTELLLSISTSTEGCLRLNDF